MLRPVSSTLGVWPGQLGWVRNTGASGQDRGEWGREPSDRASQVRGRCRGFTALSTRDRPSVRTTKRLFALRALYTVITPELGQL